MLDGMYVLFCMVEEEEKEEERRHGALRPPDTMAEEESIRWAVQITLMTKSDSGKAARGKAQQSRKIQKE